MARQIVNICDVCTEIFAGGDAPKDRLSEVCTPEYNVPVYSNGEANEGLYGYTDRARVFLPSITVSARGTIGFTAIRNEPFVPIVRLISITPDPLQIDIKYLYYAAQNYHFDGSGTSIPQLTVPMLKNYSFPLPSIPVQRHIAAVLDKVSDLIALRKQQLAKLDELAKARFVEMFGDLKSNPNGWHFKPLSDVCDVRDGTHDSPKYVDSGYPLLTSKNFTNGFVDFSDANLISAKDFDLINQRSKVDFGDIVMPMIGTIGHPVIIDTDRPFAIKNVALIKFCNSAISNIFVREVLDSGYFRSIVEEKNRGNTQKFIALGDIRRLQIPIVNTEMQNQFASYIKQVNQSKTTVQQGLDKLETLKSALMQEYFG